MRRRSPRLSESDRDGPGGSGSGEIDEALDPLLQQRDQLRLHEAELVGDTEHDDALRAQRLQVLHASLNHVVPLTARTAAGAEAVLRKRWEQPRFRALGNVFMQYGFLAWHTGSLPSALGDGLVFVLRHTFGAVEVSPDGVWTVFRLPRETWHAAAWLLIEANALLIKVDLPPAHAIPFPAWDPVSLPDEHHGRWWVTLPADVWIEDVVRYWKRMALARRAARAEVDE